jgi:hypothetical protein
VVPDRTSPSLASAGARCPVWTTFGVLAQGVKLAEVEELRLQIAELKQQAQAMQAALLNSHQNPLVAQR